MKKLIILFIFILTFTSCITSSKQDLFMLQQKFPNAYFIYMVNDMHYIIEDSLKNVYDVKVDLGGDIDYKIKLN